MPSVASNSRPSSLACSECRKRHLKCDAGQPTCSRCIASGLQCNYIPSRRGYRGSPYRTNESGANYRMTNPSNTISLNSIHDGAQAEAAVTTLQNDAFNPHPAFETPVAGPSSRPFSVHEGQQDPTQADELLVDLYYTNFHPSHPILVPRNWFTAQGYPVYLKLVIQLIGSHYSTSASGDTRISDTANALEAATEKSAGLVQAKLLFAIATHVRNDTSTAQTVLREAVELALELRMNDEAFAIVNGAGNSIVEESLRRTWWEVYVIDGFIAALYRRSPFTATTVRLGTLLLCEESAYQDAMCLSGNPSLTQFNERFFADEELQYSSYCYRIEAIRLLGRVIAIAGVDGIHADQVQAVDNALASWMHHLPPEKSQIVDTVGNVDEMLFQAHMVVHCATIFLHMPRSDLLDLTSATAEIICVRGDRSMLPAETRHQHGVKATDASKQLSNLAALRYPVEKHTPFFACALALSATVQLSACTVHDCHSVDQHRDRIMLLIGLLKTLSRTWQISGSILDQIRNIAIEVLHARKEPDAMPPNPISQTSARDSGINMDDEPEATSWLDLINQATFEDMAQYDGFPFAPVS